LCFPWVCAAPCEVLPHPFSGRELEPSPLHASIKLKEFSCFATAAKGIEALLAEELRGLGARDIKPARAGVAFNGSPAVAYRLCLWSRLASRVLLTLSRFPAPDPQALYEGVRAIDWDEHLTAAGTLAVDLSSVGSAITHTQFGALKVKDAIVDQFRERFGARPSVDTLRPEVRVNVYLCRDEATISIDLAGQSLHRRGYRIEQVEAPLKENLAAAILLRAGWPRLASEGAPLVDPMCGSGTLPIEAALMAGDIAPGLRRTYFGFLGWRQHDRSLWSALLDEARQRREQGVERLPPLWGYDSDAHAVGLAERNVSRAGLAGRIAMEQRALPDCRRPLGTVCGLVVVNPPYGQRLGEAASLPAAYRALGVALKRGFPGWRAAVFTGNPACGGHLGLRAHKVHKFYNGALRCNLLHLELHAPPAAKPFADHTASGAVMFGNRVRKNYKQLRRWAAREDIACYRVYDADLPEYNLAIDLYQNGECFVHVQEYEAPSTVDEHRARARLNEALAVIPEVFAVIPEHVFLKQRRRQRAGSQYERLGGHGRFHTVREGACRFLVNFTDHLDTGLFLDQRLTRTMLGELAAGRRFLNLFAYTGTATVYAAVGGALSTTTVDMSRTYLEWAQRNLALNGIGGGRHELVRADALKWLNENRRRRFGLIFIDPPSFSRSKRMTDTLDVQRDHVPLIRAAAAALEPDGALIFSTHLRRFRLDRAGLSDLAVEDMSSRTIHRDFARNPRVHKCFRIQRCTPIAAGRLALKKFKKRG
jgi:23S rRNA (guanine2445-N2)-methyltransferase / 23S rRNA (guanine2069-N7)-methyltransferase